MPRALAAVLLLSALVAAGLAAQKEPVEVKVSFFLHGTDYLKLPEVAKGAYVTGVVDGLLDARAAFGAPKKRTAWLEDCVVGMSSEQLAAIVDKYLREHPEEWNWPMNGLVDAAMFDACRAYRKTERVQRGVRGLRDTNPR